jgi:hypothetical protein
MPGSIPTIAAELEHAPAVDRVEDRAAELGEVRDIAEIRLR